MATRDGWPRFGAFSYDYPGDDLAGLIAAFRREGLSAIQIGSWLLDQAVDDPASIPGIRAALAEGGITVAGLAGYRNLIAPDTTRRAANLAFLRRCLAMAPQLGTPVVATETGTRNAESDWRPSPENQGPEAWALFHAALDDLLPVAERHGAILALEGYVNNVLATVDQLAELLDRYRSPHLGVVLDPFNYLAHDLLPDGERVVADFLARFADRFVLAHLKDVSAEGAETDTPEFGLGVFPQRRYLDFLRTERPDLPIIFEHLPFAHIPAAIGRFHAIMDDEVGGRQ